MLTHHRVPPAVLPGSLCWDQAASWRALIEKLKADDTPVRAIGRQEINLLAADAGEQLAGELEAGDTLVFLLA